MVFRGHSDYPSVVAWTLETRDTRPRMLVVFFDALRSASEDPLQTGDAEGANMGRNRL
jgi:hypothetical protein